MEFQFFDKVLQIGKLYMSITQKLHGTNAQIYIPDESHWPILAGSRTRWLTSEADNYGFARFVADNTEEIRAKLRPGRHYGEWVGAGINAGEGFVDKKLFLFNWREFKDQELPNNIWTVPVLYSGKFSWEAIEDTMTDLKTLGSRAMPGYMQPEGVVIEINGQLFKKVFAQEDVKWMPEKKERPPKEYPDLSHLMQPLRLEKLFSRDEGFLMCYPENIRDIVKFYTDDLIAEDQLKSDDLNDKLFCKAFNFHVYPFIKEVVRKLQDVA